MKSFILVLLFNVSVNYAYSIDKVLAEDKFIFNVAGEVYSLLDIKNLIEEIKSLSCYYPNSLLVQLFKNEAQSFKAGYFNINNNLSKKAKEYIIELLKLTKLIVYSKSEKVEVNPSLKKYFYLSAVRLDCSLKTFDKLKNYNPYAKEIIRLEVFLRSRFLSVERGGNVTKKDFNKAISSAKGLLLSIEKQVKGEVIW